MLLFFSILFAHVLGKPPIWFGLPFSSVNHLIWHTYIISQKETVLVLEENQSLENALRKLLQELVVTFYVATLSFDLT